MVVRAGLVMVFVVERVIAWVLLAVVVRALIGMALVFVITEMRRVVPWRGQWGHHHSDGNGLMAKPAGW